MAKEKKVQTFTIEEKLEQALVPEGEQPYAIPENWVWVKLNSIGEIVTGATPSKKRADYYGGNFPFFKPADLNQGRNVYEASDYLTTVGKGICRIIPSQSTAVCCIGTIGKCGFLMCEGTTNQQINSIIPQINPLLVYYYCCTEMFLNQLNSVASATTISIVNKSKMSSCSFPLPPLPEQHRIVARIESLFEKLDHARELVQSALDSFKSRKAAILHKAFAGELTAKWREKNGVKLESWEYKQLEEVCISIYDGDHMAPPKREFGIPFLVISNINKGYVTFEETRFVPEDYYNSLSETRTPQEGDLLYSIVGSFGIPAIVKENIKFCFQRHIALLRPDTKYLNYKCFWYIMQTQEIFNQVDSIATGTAQRTVPIRGLRKISFSFPSLLEQQEIVRTLDSLLEKEQNAKDKLEPILDHIALIKKSILARAFRGELGTNDPSGESAMELLKNLQTK